MKNKLLLVLGAVLVMVAIGFVRAGEGAPPIFDTRAYPVCFEAAKNEHKLLLVKGTAAWCGPCKLMDKTTWRDEQVIAWAKDHAIVVALDVDAQPKIAQELNITAMPTMILFKDAQELDRVVGYRDAQGLLAWLGRAEKGEKSEVQVHKAAGGGAGRQSAKTRLDAARDLLSRNKLAEASDEYAWLWEHMLELEPSMVGVRGSYMASEMKRLASLHEPARARFSEFRDATETRLKGDQKTFRDLNDWIVLNDVVADQDRTLAWFDRIKNDPDSGPTLRRVGFLLEGLLLERERWADYGRMVRDPQAQLMQNLMIEKAGANVRANLNDPAMERDLHRTFVNELSNLYRALLAADRDDDARAYALQARAEIPSPDLIIALVRAAIAAGKPGPEHGAWLDEADKNPGDDADELARVRAELNAARKK